MRNDKKLANICLNEFQNLINDLIITFKRFRLQQIESEFFKHASVNETARSLDVDLDVVDIIYNFWILKRKVLFADIISASIYHCERTSNLKNYFHFSDLSLTIDFD